MDHLTKSIMAAMSAEGLARTSAENIEDVLQALAKGHGASSAPADRNAVLEEAALIAENYGPGRPILTRNPGALIQGRWEGEQAASTNIAVAIRAATTPASAQPAEQHLWRCPDGECEWEWIGPAQDGKAPLCSHSDCAQEMEIVSTASAQPVAAAPAELRKAFMTLESSGGEGRIIVLKFNQRADACAVHDYLLMAGSQDYRVDAAPAAPVARVNAASAAADQWIYDLAAEHEKRRRGLYGPITFDATSLLDFARALLATHAASTEPRNCEISQAPGIGAPVAQADDADSLTAGYRLVRLEQHAYRTKRGAIYGGTSNKGTPLYVIVDEAIALTNRSGARAAPVMQAEQGARQEAAAMLEKAAELAIKYTRVPGDLLGAPSANMKALAATGEKIAAAIRALGGSRTTPCRNCANFGWEPSVSGERRPCHVCTKAPAPIARCAAGRDGECGHAQCPQLRDGEPAASGRHCPLDAGSDA